MSDDDLREEIEVLRTQLRRLERQVASLEVDRKLTRSRNVAPSTTRHQRLSAPSIDVISL